MAQLVKVTDPSELEKIAALAAKPANSRMAERMNQYEGFVRDLKPGEIAALQAEEGETARGLSLRVKRAATRVGITDMTTTISGNTLYFSRPKVITASESNGGTKSKAKEPATA